MRSGWSESPLTRPLRTLLNYSTGLDLAGLPCPFGSGLPESPGEEAFAGCAAVEMASGKAQGEPTE